MRHSNISFETLVTVNKRQSNRSQILFITSSRQPLKAHLQGLGTPGRVVTITIVLMSGYNRLGKQSSALLAPWPFCGMHHLSPAAVAMSQLSGLTSALTQAPMAKDNSPKTRIPFKTPTTTDRPHHTTTAYIVLQQCRQYIIPLILIKHTVLRPALMDRKPMRSTTDHILASAH